MFKGVCFAVAVLLTGPSYGQQIDGIGWIVKHNGDQIVDWCGVAVSDRHIVTCGHHEQTGDVRIEFCAEKHGNEVRLIVPGTIIATDMNRDLSVIEYRAPKWAKIKHYKVGRAKKSPVITGFLRGVCQFRPAKFSQRKLNRNGFQIIELHVDVQVGMSGSPLLEDDMLCGILTGTNQGGSDCVDPQVITEYLSEIIR
jgi:hypothetical protein